MNESILFGKKKISVNNLNMITTLLKNILVNDNENFVCILGCPEFYEAMLLKEFKYLNRGAKLKYLKEDIKILYTPLRYSLPNGKAKDSILNWIRQSDTIKEKRVLVIVIARENPFKEYGIKDFGEQKEFREKMVVIDCKGIKIPYSFENPNNNFNNNFNRDQQGITFFQQTRVPTNNNLLSNRTGTEMELEELGPLPLMNNVIINNNQQTLNNMNGFLLNLRDSRNEDEMEETFISGTNQYI